MGWYNTNMKYDDTIVAIATPPGQGAIGIIRISGSDALAILHWALDTQEKT